MSLEFQVSPNQPKEENTFREPPPINVLDFNEWRQKLTRLNVLFGQEPRYIHAPKIHPTEDLIPVEDIILLSEPNRSREESEETTKTHDIQCHWCAPDVYPNPGAKIGTACDTHVDLELKNNRKSKAASSPPMQTAETNPQIVVVCARCIQKSGKTPDANQQVSHGYCDNCAEETRNQITSKTETNDPFNISAIYGEKYASSKRKPRKTA